jgi:hypothetical protein
MAVPPSQFQPGFAAAVCGTPGNGELSIDEFFREATEPVTSFAGASFDWACDRNGLELKRAVSELQLTAAIEIVAMTATRYQRSERPGSSTQRIGLSHSYATGRRES